MAVKHNLSFLNGQPRLNERDVTVAAVVRGVVDEGMDEFCSSHKLTRRDVEEALRYCKEQFCVRDFAAYCVGCSKNPKYSGRKSRDGRPLGRDFWEIARGAYTEKFREE